MELQPEMDTFDQEILRYSLREKLDKGKGRDLIMKKQIIKLEEKLKFAKENNSFPTGAHFYAKNIVETNNETEEDCKKRLLTKKIFEQVNLLKNLYNQDKEKDIPFEDRGHNISPYTKAWHIINTVDGQETNDIYCRTTTSDIVMVKKIVDELLPQ